MYQIGFIIFWTVIKQYSKSSIPAGTLCGLLSQCDHKMYNNNVREAKKTEWMLWWWWPVCFNIIMRLQQAAKQNINLIITAACSEAFKYLVRLDYFKKLCFEISVCVFYDFIHKKAYIWYIWNIKRKKIVRENFKRESLVSKRMILYKSACELSCVL